MTNLHFQAATSSHNWQYNLRNLLKGSFGLIALEIPVEEQVLLHAYYDYDKRIKWGMLIYKTQIS